MVFGRSADRDRLDTPVEAALAILRIPLRELVRCSHLCLRPRCGCGISHFPTFQGVSDSWLLAFLLRWLALRRSIKRYSPRTRLQADSRPDSVLHSMLFFYFAPDLQSPKSIMLSFASGVSILWIRRLCGFEGLFSGQSANDRKKLFPTRDLGVVRGIDTGNASLAIVASTNGPGPEPLFWWKYESGCCDESRMQGNRVKSNPRKARD